MLMPSLENICMTIFQRNCSPYASNCIEDILTQDLGCGVSCIGLYADKEHSDITLYTDKALYRERIGLLELAEIGICLFCLFVFLFSFVWILISLFSC